MNTLHTLGGRGVPAQVSIFTSGYTGIEPSPFSARSGSATRTATVYGYDSGGRVNQVRQCFDPFCAYRQYDMSYNYLYNADGTMQSESYPAQGYQGAPVTNAYTYSPAGTLLTLAQTRPQGGTTQTTNILSNAVLGPNGLASYQTGNGAQTNLSFDSLGRNVGTVSCKNGVPASSGLACASGSMLYGYSITPKGSQVTQTNDTILGLNNVTYDEFSRLKSINYTGIGLPMNWTYDRYGNRWTQSLGQGATVTAPQPQNTYDLPTNHNTGYTYDAAGNVTSTGMTYDAEGMAIGFADGVQHLYDPAGHLVREYVPNGYDVKFAYGLNNRREATLDGSANLYWSQIYAGSTPLAFYTASTGAYTYQYQNQVGSEAARDTNGQTTIFSSLPFGDAPAIGGAGQDVDPYHFAGMDVSETNMSVQQSTTHHAQFRDYGAASGQWLSPDPYDGSYSLSNPQTLNRYVYVLNNPLVFYDPRGLQCVYFTNGTVGDDGSDPPCDHSSPGASVDVDGSEDGGVLNTPGGVGVGYVPQPGAPGATSNPKQMPPHTPVCYERGCVDFDAPPPSCKSFQTEAILIGGAGTAGGAYAGAAALFPVLGLPAAATVGSVSAILRFGGVLYAGAAYFHIGCTP